MTGPVVSRIERVVVPLDTASDNRTAIDTAARLARRWQARLHGVFVEDEELYRLAGLPFARQVGLGGRVEHFTATHAADQLRAFAAAARRDVAAASRRHDVAWSFEVRRGAEQGVAAAGDFLVAGTATRPVGRHFQVECRWWQTVETAAVSCLIARQAWAADGPIVVVLRDRGAVSERLLAVAGDCAAAGPGRLTVFAEATGFAAWPGEIIAPDGVDVQVEPLPGDQAELMQRCAELGCRLLVVAAEGLLLRRMAEQIACDVLVVR